MTDWRARCVELLNGIELDVAHEGIENPDRFQALINRTRAELAKPYSDPAEERRLGYLKGLEDCAHAALAQPEPEGPTDEELLAAQDQAVASFPPIHPEAEALSAVEYARELEIRKGRAVLARWGRPTITPIPASKFLEPEWMRQEDQTRKTTDHAQLIDGEWWAPCSDLFSMQRILDNARAYAARPAIEPVPVAERPWERDGWCDAEGRCWMVNELLEWAFRKQYKSLDSYYFYGYTHLLPHWALPVPTSQEIL